MSAFHIEHVHAAHAPLDTFATIDAAIYEAKKRSRLGSDVLVRDTSDLTKTSVRGVAAAGAYRSALPCKPCAGQGTTKSPATKMMSDCTRCTGHGWRLEP